MPTRKIIRIDEETCNGCGDCVTACAEGAIQIINGKARLVSETYCDGLGACLGDCPTGALTIEEREAPEFDPLAVDKHLAAMKSQPAAAPAPVSSGCPGAAMRQMAPAPTGASADGPCPVPSQLGHWPIQLTLVSPQAPFLKGADVLVCADCVPFTVPDFHARYLAGRVVLVGCPKLDDLQHYFEKLKAIFAEAQPRRVTVLRMEVPCCGGIAEAAVQARNEVVPQTEAEVHIIGIRGNIHEQKVPAPAGAANSSG